MAHAPEDRALYGYDVFIRHAEANIVVARTLQQELSLAGFRVFLPELGAEAGEDFGASRAEALATARAVVVLVSGEQTLTASQALELDYAQARGRLGRALLITVTSPEVQLRNLPPGLREFHGISAHFAHVYEPASARTPSLESLTWWWRRCRAGGGGPPTWRCRPDVVPLVARPSLNEFRQFRAAQPRASHGHDHSCCSSRRSAVYRLTGPR